MRRSSGYGTPEVHRPRTSQRLKEINLATKDFPSSATVVTPPPGVKLSSENFTTRLSRKKILWRATCQQRKDGLRKRSLEGLNYASSAVENTEPTKVKKPCQANGSMMGYLRDAALIIHNEEWQIVEVRDSASSSGELIVWLIVNGKNLQRVIKFK